MRFYKEDTPFLGNPVHCELEGLTQALQGFFSNPADTNMLKLGIAGAGEGGNILQQIKQNEYRDFVMNLLNNPQQLANMAAKITAPLNNNLVQSVDNTVQGNMASRGLAQAPGIFAASESQALAPYEQANQNTALQTIMQALGVPAGTFGQQQNLSPLFASLFNNTKVPQQTSSPMGLVNDQGSSDFLGAGLPGVSS
jgi:hypothetical protein